MRSIAKAELMPLETRGPGCTFSALDPPQTELQSRWRGEDAAGAREVPHATQGVRRQSRSRRRLAARGAGPTDSTRRRNGRFYKTHAEARSHQDARDRVRGQRAGERPAGAAHARLPL